MSMLLGLMCVFVACSTPGGAPARPNLVVTVAPGAAQIEVDGNSAAQVLSRQNTALQTRRAAVSSYLVDAGAYYTVNIDAQGHAGFSRKYFLRDGRKVNLEVGLARKGGTLPEGGYAEAFEAENALISQNLVVKNDDARASSGRYLVQPPEIGNTTKAKQDARIDLFVPEAGNYTLWTRVFAPTADSDAIYAGLNGQLDRVFVDIKGEYIWFETAQADLKEGSNRISIGHAEAGVRLDTFILTNKRLSERELNEFITTVREEETDIETPTPTAPTSTANYPMRGDPNFSESSLNAEQRTWYKRLWAAIENPDLYPHVDDFVDDNNLYLLGRPVSTYHRALLNTFRLTGDLRLLDEVDVTAQEMRAQLKDGWCRNSNSYNDDHYGTVYGRDGYLNWVQKKQPNDDERNYCRDLHEQEETVGHGHVAMLMYAYHSNRDLKSPSGIDYGERADFWLDYLRNHYEAKWRERSGAEFPDMNFFVRRVYAHPHMRLLSYFYYVGKRLEDDGDPDAKYYLDEAKRMTDEVFNTAYIRNKQGGGFVDVATPIGPAYVYAFGLPNGSSDLMTRAAPTTYGRYVVEDALELHFEGFYRWKDEAVMTKLANGLAYFIMDTDKIKGVKTPFAESVTGDKGAAGIPPSGYRTRLDAQKYALSSFAFLAPWNGSGRVSNINAQVYDEIFYDKDEPRYTTLPAAMFLDAYMK